MSVDLHLLVTSICDRDCKYCCNKQYDLNEVPYATERELQNVKNIFLTGGEPFIYAQPNNIARRLKRDYPNIKNVIVYTNAFELQWYLELGGKLDAVDGVTVSIKSTYDMQDFGVLIHDREIRRLKSNRLYVFEPYTEVACPDGWTKMVREWQEHFIPAANSIFRRI